MVEHKHSFQKFCTAASAAFFAPAALAVSALFLFSACTQTAAITGTNKGAETQQGDVTPQATFTDIPIPDGAKMVVDKTLVVGSINWFGQLTLQTGQSPNTVFDFYRSRLPAYQWREITSVRAPISVLTYDREDRILQMQIRSSTILGSEITITVSPRGSSNMPSGGSGGGGLMPAPVTRIN